MDGKVAGAGEVARSHEELWSHPSRRWVDERLLAWAMVGGKSTRRRKEHAMPRKSAGNKLLAPR
jgi:hypothetical protein